MGNKRVGLARTQALIENLKRELQMNGSEMKGISKQVITLSGAGATKTLEATDSGAIVQLGGSDLSVVTLPAVEAGLNFRFVATTAAFAHKIDGGATVIQGGYHHNTNAATVARVAVVNKSSLALHGLNTMIGDTLDLWCDGTNWYVSGIVNAAITQEE
jgi:hypothetical protein